MHIRSLAAALALVTASLTGCATVGSLPTQTSVDRTRTFEAPFDQVWPAIIGEIAETNLKITTLEKASGLIAIADSTYSPNDANEGVRGSVLGSPDQVGNRSASLNIFATSPTPNRTTVRVNVGLKMYIRTGNGSLAFPFVYKWEEAYSNGNIEKSLLDGIARRTLQK